MSGVYGEGLYSLTYVGKVTSLRNTELEEGI